MFTSPITLRQFNGFLSSYQSLKKAHVSSRQPYVFADKDGVRLIANIVGDEQSMDIDSVFALSVAEDGWMELLTLYE